MAFGLVGYENTKQKYGGATMKLEEAIRTRMRDEREEKEYKKKEEDWLNSERFS